MNNKEESLINGGQANIEAKSVKNDEVAGNIFARMEQLTINSKIVFIVEDLLKIFHFLLITHNIRA